MKLLHAITLQQLNSANARFLDPRRNERAKQTQIHPA